MLLEGKLFLLCYRMLQGRMRNFLSVLDNIYYSLETKFVFCLSSHSVVFTKQVLNLMSDSTGNSGRTQILNWSSSTSMNKLPVWCLFWFVTS